MYKPLICLNDYSSVMDRAVRSERSGSLEEVTGSIPVAPTKTNDRFLREPAVLRLLSGC